MADTADWKVHQLTDELRRVHGEFLDLDDRIAASGDSANPELYKELAQKAERAQEISEELLVRLGAIN